MELSEDAEALPLPIQTFLWRQSRFVSFVLSLSSSIIHNSFYVITVHSSAPSLDDNRFRLLWSSGRPVNPWKKFWFRTSSSG